MHATRDGGAASDDAIDPTWAAPPRAGFAPLLLLALSVFGLGTLAWAIAARFAFPWPLEWMEGATLQHALRLLQGEPLYAPPSADFVAYLYPPLAYVPMAVSAALLGPTLLAARLPSLAFTLGALLLIGRAATRAADGRPLAGLVAAGLFAVGFGYTGAFLDLARVDACFVFLVVAAAERVLAGKPRAALAWLVLSAFAKQHGALLLAALALALLVQDRRGHAKAVGASLAALLAAYVALQLGSDGWFARYTLELPASHAPVPVLFLSFFGVDLLACLPALVLAAGFELARRARRAAFTPFDALLLAALVAGALGRAHPGGHDNVRLPAFALLCIAGAVPLCRAALGPRGLGVRAGACAALALQFALLMVWMAPSFHAPPRRSARAFAELRAALERCAGGGDAVALDHALLTPTPFVHTMALSDLRMDERSALARAGTAALLARFASDRAPAAIAVGEAFPELTRALARRYRPCAQVAAPRLATGYRPGAPTEQGLLQRIYTLR